MKGQFWSLGECMLEMQNSTSDTFTTAAAGDTYNAAVYLKRILPAADVRYVSALGNDPISQRIRMQVRVHNIDDSLIAALPERLPGLYLIENDPQGERRFHYWRQNSAARDMLSGSHLQKIISALPDCGALLFTGITLAILDQSRRETLLRIASEIRQQGGWVIVDNNYRPSLWALDDPGYWLSRAIDVSTHALLGFDDEAALFADVTPDAVINRIRARNRDVEIIIKLGASGCLVAPPGEASIHVSAMAVPVVDTTAAGDSFNGAYLAARIFGLTPLASAELACRLAERVVGKVGAIIPANAMADLVLVPAV